MTAEVSHNAKRTPVYLRQKPLNTKTKLDLTKLFCSFLRASQPLFPETKIEIKLGLYKCHRQKICFYR